MGAAAIVCCLCFRHCTPPTRQMPAAEQAAFAAVPDPGAARLLESWRALEESPADKKRRVRSVDGGSPAIARHSAQKVFFLELPCKFSRNRNDRAGWDIPVGGDFTPENGIAFDVWCGDVTQFTGFTCYFKSGDGWYYTDFSPCRERQWHRLAISKARAKNIAGKPEGWNKISGVRICGWRGGTNDTELAVANFAWAEPVRPETPAEALARELDDRQWAATRRSVQGEWRGFWCHSRLGLGGGKTWDDTARLLKENGFTAVLPNLAWAGVAYYRSRQLPEFYEVRQGHDRLEECLAACRRHSLECHVWKVCWNLGHHVSKKVQTAFAKAERTQVRNNGEAKPGWLCPSHPLNLVWETQAVIELAKKGVDGVHLDYIRYPDESCCFCAGCRRRFEAMYALTLTNWPGQVRHDAELKAKWQNFRITNITKLVQAVAEGVRAVSPGVKVSAAVFQNPETNPRAIGQDWVDWCRRGYLDFVCPMDYNYDSPVAFKGVVHVQKRALAGMAVKLRPGIGLSCWPDRTRDVRMAVGEIEAVREAGLEGFSIFNLDARAEKLLPVLRLGVTRDD